MSAASENMSGKSDYLPSAHGFSCDIYSLGATFSFLWTRAELFRTTAATEQGHVANMQTAMSKSQMWAAPPDVRGLYHKYVHIDLFK